MPYMNLAVVSSDREKLYNVIEATKFDDNPERSMAKAKEHAYKLAAGWANTMGFSCIVVEVPADKLNNCRDINNIDGFHQYRRV